MRLYVVQAHAVTDDEANSASYVYFEGYVYAVSFKKFMTKIFEALEKEHIHLYRIEKNLDRIEENPPITISTALRTGKAIYSQEDFIRNVVRTVKSKLHLAGAEEETETKKYKKGDGRTGVHNAYMKMYKEGGEQ